MYCEYFFPQLLEENIVTFVKNELKKIHRVLSPDYPDCLDIQGEDEEMVDGEEQEQRRSSNREAFLKITQHFLRRMKQEELADSLQNSKRLFINVKIVDLVDSIPSSLTPNNLVKSRLYIRLRFLRYSYILLPVFRGPFRNQHQLFLVFFFTDTYIVVSSAYIAMHT